MDARLQTYIMLSIIVMVCKSKSTFSALLVASRKDLLGEVPVFMVGASPSERAHIASRVSTKELRTDGVLDEICDQLL